MNGFFIKSLQISDSILELRNLWTYPDATIWAFPFVTGFSLQLLHIRYVIYKQSFTCPIKPKIVLIINFWIPGFACGLCERTYIRPKDCRDHIAGNHMNFVLKCPYCPVQSTQKPRYKYHLYKFHRNEPTYNEKVKEYQKIPMPNVEKYIRKIDTPIVDKKN